MISPSDFYKNDIKEISNALHANDLRIDEIDFERILESGIDKSMRYHHGNNVYEEARVYNSVPIYFIDKIVAKYLDAGWRYIYVTMINKGITIFKFSNTEIVGLTEPHILYTSKTTNPIFKKV